MSDNHSESLPEINGNHRVVSIAYDICHWERSEESRNSCCVTLSKLR